MAELRETPFHDRQAALGGRFVDFHGWHMPVQFRDGIIDEHRHVRSAVGLFDVSHMGEIELLGPGALEAANRLVTNDVAAIEDGQACYTPVCQPDGGIVDDVIVYRRTPEHIFVCVNASNREKDAAWFREQVGGRCEVRDRSDDYAQLALQGPKAPAVLAAAFPGEGAAFADSPPFRHTDIEVGGERVMVATTGYTGERGFELYIPVAIAGQVWDRLMEAGAADDLRPIGLGARDTLRLEMRFCLYGNDIDETTTPLEAGLAWTVKLDKGDFVGKDALVEQHEGGLTRRLVGFKMLDRGIPRQGYEVFVAPDPERADDLVKVGQVTSGTRSPSLEEAIGLAYVDVPYHKRGRKLLVDIRGRKRAAKVVRTPFLKQ